MDLVHQAMQEAAARFGGSDGILNSAGFGLALTDLAGMVTRGLDGKLVRAILSGRPDVQELPGGSHFRILNHPRAFP